MAAYLRDHTCADAPAPAVPISCIASIHLVACPAGATAAKTHGSMEVLMGACIQHRGSEALVTKPSLRLCCCNPGRATIVSAMCHACRLEDRIYGQHTARCIVTYA